MKYTYQEISNKGKEISFKTFQWASSEYLCEEVPDNWNSLNLEAKEEYINENVHEDHEEKEVRHLIFDIENLARHALDFFKQ